MYSRNNQLMNKYNDIKRMNKKPLSEGSAGAPIQGYSTLYAKVYDFTHWYL